MGIYDREYGNENLRSDFRSPPQMRMGMPRITPIVKWLLIINVAVFILQIVFKVESFWVWFAVYPKSWITDIQLWRYATYQFLHGDIQHIFFNMLGLYFLGPVLEQYWGGRKFLGFYLGCGIIGGLFYVLLANMKILSAGEMIGASGSILGMLSACAILFPQFVVFIYFFPVPIRIAAIVLIIMAVATILSKGFNAGGEAAHLGGIAAGAVYVWSQSWRTKFKLKLKAKQWQKQAAEERKLQFEIDNILKKVHESGIQSLTSKEKKILKKATEIQQKKTSLWEHRSS